MTQAGFSIQFVSNVTGINPHTIRAWEKRYQAVVPSRTPKGKRIYSQEDIDRLNSLHDLVKLGNSISDIAKRSSEELQSLLGQFNGQKSDISHNSQASQSYVHQSSPNRGDHSLGSIQTSKSLNLDVNTTLQHLIMALRGFKLDIISHELTKMKEVLGPRQFALSILAPLLAEVGVLVEKSYISIAQEHALSAILKFHIGQILYQFVARHNKSNLVVAISTPEGELHEFGIMIAALLCSYYNINFYYLGPNMPAESLAQAANQIQAKIVILGLSRVYNTDPSNNLESYVTELRENISSDMSLWLGGVSEPSKYLDQSEVECIPTLQMLDQRLSKMTR